MFGFVPLSTIQQAATQTGAPRPIVPNLFPKALSVNDFKIIVLTAEELKLWQLEDNFFDRLLDRHIASTQKKCYRAYRKLH